MKIKTTIVVPFSILSFACFASSFPLLCPEAATVYSAVKAGKNSIDSGIGTMSITLQAINLDKFNTIFFNGAFVFDVDERLSFSGAVACYYAYPGAPTTSSITVQSTTGVFMQDLTSGGWRWHRHNAPPGFLCGVYPPSPRLQTDCQFTRKELI